MEERRRTLLANPTFQHRWMLTTVLAGFILINLVLIVAYLTMGGVAIAPNAMLQVAIAVAAAEIIALGVIIYLARRQSNRIAGPLLRVQQVANALAEGDLTTHASVRNDDYFHQELQALDTAVIELREHIKALQRASTSGGDASSIREQLNWFRTE